MPGLLPTFDKGPLTFAATTVANGGNIKGGMLVEPDGTTGRVKPASAASAVCLGVALGDASASDFANADTTDTWGNTIVNAQYPPNEVAVAWQGVFKLKVAATSATVPFGALVKCAANGEVTLHSTTSAATFDVIIGRCVEPLGIVAGARGKINLNCAGA
jgi:hypothetical protein